MATLANDFNPTPEDNLSRYLQVIRRYPMLTHEEEMDLARRWRDDEEHDAAHQMVNSHLRLVAKIAMGYRGYGLPVGELISEGNIGMMQAVKRFDPERGFRLATYAMWWIRAAIQEYILHSWSLVKIGTTAAQKKLFFNLRRIKGEIEAIDDGDLTPEQTKIVADRLKVSHQEVINMNRRLAGPDHSLNAPLRQEEEGEWIDWLFDHGESHETTIGNAQEFNHRHDMLKGAMKCLTDRERYILTERRLKDDPMTLQDLSNVYGISRERVRQIEVRAFEKVRKSVRTAAIREHRVN